MRKKTLELIKLDELNFHFKKPPLLVAGMAMMYYNLRESGKDIDLIVDRRDHKNLALFLKNEAIIFKGKYEVGYKDRPLLVDLYGDHGILFHKFEIWDNIMKYGYDELKKDAIKEKGLLIISLEKLMFLCTIRGAFKKRYLDDALLIAKHLTDKKYQRYKHKSTSYWRKLLK